VEIYTNIEEYARSLVNRNFHSDDALLKNRRIKLITNKEITIPFHHKGVKGIIVSCIYILILLKIYFFMAKNYKVLSYYRDWPEPQL